MKQIEISAKMFEGCVSVEKLENGYKPWRGPHEKRNLFTSSEGDQLLTRMACASGVRLRFKTDARKIAITLGIPSQEDVIEKYDLTINGELIDSKTRASDSNTIEFDIPSDGAKIAELWLTQKCPVVLQSLSVNDGAELTAIPDDRLKWTTYGSSITHCVQAHSPARTWPAVAARKLDLNLTSLGYGGQCHMEPMLAMMIRDIPADIITLKLGINVNGNGSLNPRTFKSAAIGMVKIIREKHPTTPIGIISPIICPPREDTKNDAGLSLNDMRAELKDAVKRIVETDGDENLFYFNGLDLFGEDLVGPLLPDELHPNGDGNEIMGEKAAELVLSKLLNMD